VRIKICGVGASLLVGATSGAQPVGPATAQSAATAAVVDVGARSAVETVHRMESRPSIRLGGLQRDDSLEFSHNEGTLRAVPLVGGGLAVLDVTRIHVFDAAGRLVRLVGKSGRGPGEFSRAGDICRTRGDTLVVSDPVARRTTVITSEGRLVATIPHDSGAPTSGSCFDDGTVAVYRRIQTAAGLRNRIVRIALDGRVLNEIGEVPAQFPSPIATFALSLAARDSLLLVGDGSANEITLFSRSGGLRRVIRMSDPLLAISDQEARQRIEMAIPPNAPPAVAEQIRAMRFGPRPAAWPAYTKFLVATDGRIWIEEFAPALRRERPASWWTILDQRGQPVARFLLPPPGSADEPPPQLLLAFADSLVLRATDADGAAQIGIHSLRRP
jgi:hypothetical protein